MAWKGALAVACLAVACQVPTQVIPLHVQAGTRVFVDGREISTVSKAVELRSDRPHVVYLQRDGHHAQQLILTSRKTADGPRLDPESIRVRLEPVVPTERRIRIEGAD